MTTMKIGVIGCGYVADFYALCLRANAPEIEIAAVYDPLTDRATAFAETYSGQVYSSLDDLLSHRGLDAVLNLTPPKAHAEVTETALRRGKHVYSEKPLALDFATARGLIDLALSKKLGLGCAPAVHRSAAARKLRQAVQSKRGGKLTHLYCDLDDGPLHRMHPETWLSPRQLPWPLKEEFETGAVVHHMPYALMWAVALGGPPVAIKGYTTVTTKVKCGVESGPDLCLAIMEHESGCLSRLTIGALAKRQRQLIVVTEKAEFHLPDMWSVDGPLSQDDECILQPSESWPYDSTHRLNFDQGVRDLALCLGSKAGGKLFTQTYGLRSLLAAEITAMVARTGSFDARITVRLAASRGQHV